VIYAADENGILTYISPAIERLTGYSPAQVTGRPFSDFIHPQDLERARHALRRAFTGEEVANEYRVVTKDGEIRWMRTSSQPILVRGRVVGVEGVLADITQRVVAEQRLREQNEFLNKVLDSLTHPFYVVDANDYTVRIANPAARAADRPGQTTCYALGHAQDAPCATAEHACVLEEIKRTKRPLTVEHIHYDSEGQARNVEVRGYPLLDTEGNVVQVIEYLQDVTERRQAEQALRQAKEAAEQASREEGARRREAERRRQIAEGLAGAVAALNSNQSLPSVLQNIAAQATRLLESQAVAIYSLRGKERALSALVVRSEAGVCSSDGELPPGIDMLRQAVASQRPVAVGGASSARRMPASGTPQEAIDTSAECRAWLAVPIVTKDEVHGGLLLSYVQPQVFSQEEIDLAAAFADQIALAVENSRLRYKAERAAAAEERSRLARELHDSVTQALFSASLVAEVLPQVWQRSPQEALQGLDELRYLTRGALAEMRTMLLELRPAALIEAKLSALLRQLTEAVTGRVPISVVLRIESVPALPPDVHVTFYRVAQEALHNVVKHAAASQVAVSLWSSPAPAPGVTGDWQGQVLLLVTDDGRGSDAHQPGPDQLGLSIMRERAERIGAALTIHSEPGRGTQVSLVWQGKSAEGKERRSERLLEPE
jgi:PAS domain S-box-containing protein